MTVDLSGGAGASRLFGDVLIYLYTVPEKEAFAKHATTYEYHSAPAIPIYIEMRPKATLWD